ncbi:hypothetical protein [Pseudomonas sp. PLMAX]|uniref:hypothetical protein n=1 Tax=Pseudomonas sp. PLMAX TaxID=2201998 RepID=UPI0038BDEC91
MSQIIQPTSYSNYAPLRYEVTRKSCLKIAEKYQYNLRKLDKFILSEKVLYEVTPAIEIHRLGGALESFKIVQDEVEKMISYIEFYSSNRIIYDFHRILTGALLETDVDKIMLETIPRTQESCYLHFGDFNWPPEYPSGLEGVYVSFRSYKDGDRSIFFNPVYKHQFSVPLHINAEKESETNYFEIFFRDSTEGISACLENIADEIAESNEEWLDLLLNAPPEIAAPISLFAGAAVRDPGDPRINSMVAKISINCLLYLAAVPEDTHEEWDDRAPHELVKQATISEKAGTRKTAERTLANQHYIKVRMIGKHFTQHHAAHSVSSGKKSTHIRKGHFRNQAYGHDWSQHRVIFIAPKIINLGDSEIPGRIFDI